MSHEANRQEMNTLLFDNAFTFKTVDDWNSQKDRVLRWFASLKVEESFETFENAFDDSRMTVRAIKEDRQDGCIPKKCLSGVKKALAE